MTEDGYRRYSQKWQLKNGLRITCLRTYIGLCIYSKMLRPERISSVLRIEPTRTVDLDPGSNYRSRREHNLWVWSTKDVVDSTDHIVHLNQLFNTLSGREDALEELRDSGCSMQVGCYWDSDGQGGPWLDLPTIQSLSNYKLEIWWDVYFVREDSSDDA